MVLWRSMGHPRANLAHYAGQLKKGITHPLNYAFIKQEYLHYLE